MGNNLSQTTTTLHNFIIQHPHIEQEDEKEISNIYQQLIDCISDHNHKYYIENNPIISDKEYDELFSYIKKIEEYFPYIISNNSPTQQLIGQIAEWFLQAEHKQKLLSLENTYNAEDITDRENRIKKELKKKYIDENLWIDFVITPKFDWISVELIYRNKKLRKAITRWDWSIGEDITENIKMIQNIPKTLKWNIRDKLKISELSVRWEILMPIKQFTKLNKQRIIKGESPFANTRNAASGSIKLLDANEVKNRGLICFVYDLIYINAEKEIWNTHKQIINNLKKLWIPTFERIKYEKTIKDTNKYCNQKTKELLHKFPYDFDGLVIKIDDIKLRKILWSTNHHPRWQIAYKFPAEQISTKILSVDFQVGRSWIITPVANLESVNLSWVNISRVSLHNFDFIKNKDIQIHDFVRLQRSGEVIPYITSVIKERRKNTNKIIAPKTCPSCHQKISKIDIHYICTNSACPAQIKEKLIHFVSKNCLNMDGIWKSIIELLVDQKIIKDFSDLYKLKEPNTKLILRGLPGFGDKKLFEISKQLDASKQKSFRRLLNGLWIPGIWKKMAQEISKAIQEKENRKENDTFSELKKIIQDKDFLENIYGIWEKIIIWIQEFRKNNEKLLYKLYNLNLNFSSKKYNKKQKIKGKWSGKHFGITWSFPISRTDIIKILEFEWAIFDNNPNKKTNFMLIWKKAGNKSKKSKELNIKIYDQRNEIIEIRKELSKIKTKQKKEKPIEQRLF